MTWSSMSRAEREDFVRLGAESRLSAAAIARQAKTAVLAIEAVAAKAGIRFAAPDRAAPTPDAAVELRPYPQIGGEAGGGDADAAPSSPSAAVSMPAVMSPPATPARGQLGARGSALSESGPRTASTASRSGAKTSPARPPSGMPAVIDPALPTAAVKAAVPKQSTPGNVRHVETPAPPAFADAWTDERKQWAKERWADGWSAADIAHDLGISRGAVLGMLHRAGVGRPAAPAKRPAPKRPAARAHVVVRNRPPAPRPTPARPRPPADAPEPVGLRIKLVDLGSINCKWPMGDPLDADFGYCGHDRFEGEVYCAYHCRIAYLPMGQRPGGRREEAA